MKRELVVIYSARTLQDAHLLQNLLTEAGIHAAVSNAQGGSGFDTLGWEASCQVSVAADDAPRAREMALEFDRGAAVAPVAEDGPGDEGPPEEDAAPLAEMSAMRRAADHALPGLRDHREPVFRGRCGCQRRAARPCSTCDEPFEPEYPRRCEGADTNSPTATRLAP